MGNEQEKMLTEERTKLLQKAADQNRGFVLDAVTTSGNQGHLGMPLGCAEIGAVLFGELLNYHAKDPTWLNRDRLVLSVGHGCLFLYTWLHWCGYKFSIEDLKSVCKLHSKTPGHPEYNIEYGIEATTGPLGQGIANGVGFAISQKMCEAHFNTSSHKIFNNRIVILCGDGDLQEGVANEAIEFAGHQKLDNIIMLYDCNDITLDDDAKMSQSLDVKKKFEASGWEVQCIDGHSLNAIHVAYNKAKKANGKPQMIVCRTEIGRGISEVAGTRDAHDHDGAKFAKDAKKRLNLNPDDEFFISDDVKSYFQQRSEERQENYDNWLRLFQEWKQVNPEKAELLDRARSKYRPQVNEIFKMIPEHGSSKEPFATRNAGGNVLNALAKEMHTILSGSADLHRSNKNYLEGFDNFSAENRKGRNIKFGIREHAMGGIVNGISYDGIFSCFGSTFLVFSDYMRGAVRLSALSRIPSLWYWTHDSVGVGLDGPTHEPVEQLVGLRSIPNLDIIRPADPEETCGALVCAITKTDGPTGVVLSRQPIPVLNSIPVDERRYGVLHGAYIAKKEQGELKAIVISCGSELSIALDAANSLGGGIRVVSMPSMNIYDRQTDAYKEKILPSACKKRIAMEAAASIAWYKYVGLQGEVIGVDRFGYSAPGDEVLNEMGINKESLLQALKKLLEA